MQDLLNSIKYTSTIITDDIRKNIPMKKVLMFVQAKEEYPELTKLQLYKMIRISDSSLKCIMKDLNMKSFYEVPVNRKTDITVNKMINKGIKKLSLRGGAIANTNEVRGFVSPNDVSEVEDFFNYILTKKFNFPW